MFVSRKNLALIHFVPGKMTAGLHMPQPLHQGFVFLCASLLCRELQQPFPKCRIQSGVLSSSLVACLLDQVLIRAQGNILHEDSVHDSRALTPPSEEPGESK